MDENKFGVVKPSDLPAAEQRRMNPREPRPREARTFGIEKFLGETIVRAMPIAPTPQIETLPDFKSDEMKDLLKRLRAKEKGNGRHVHEGKGKARSV